MHVPTTPSNNSYYFAIFSSLYVFEMPFKSLLSSPPYPNPSHLSSTLKIINSPLSGVVVPMHISYTVTTPARNHFCLFLHLAKVIILILL